MSGASKCTATNRKGERCGRYPVRGGTVCTNHGGRTPAVLASAKKRLQERELKKLAEKTLGSEFDVSPTEALLEEIRWTAGHVKWLRERVQDLETKELSWGKTRTEQSTDDSKTVETATPNVIYELYARERAHLVSVASAALRAGVEERRVRLAEQQGDLITLVLRAALDGIYARMTAAGLPDALDTTWREAVMVEVPLALRAVASEA